MLYVCQSVCFVNVWGEECVCVYACAFAMCVFCENVCVFVRVRVVFEHVCFVCVREYACVL